MIEDDEMKEMRERLENLYEGIKLLISAEPEDEEMSDE